MSRPAIAFRALIGIAFLALAYGLAFEVEPLFTVFERLDPLTLSVALGAYALFAFTRWKSTSAFFLALALVGGLYSIWRLALVDLDIGRQKDQMLALLAITTGLPPLLTDTAPIWAATDWPVNKRSDQLVRRALSAAHHFAPLLAVLILVLPLSASSPVN